MARFYCEAMDATGREIRGLVDAEVNGVADNVLEECVQAAFRRRGYFVTRLDVAKRRHEKFPILFTVDEKDMRFFESLNSRETFDFGLLDESFDPEAMRDELFGGDEPEFEFGFGAEDDDSALEPETFLDKLADEMGLDSSINLDPKKRNGETPKSVEEGHVAKTPKVSPVDNSGDLFERSVRLSCFVRGRVDAWEKLIAEAKDGEFLNALSYTDSPVSVTNEFFRYTLTLVRGHWSHVDAGLEIYVFSVDNRWVYAFWRVPAAEDVASATFAKRLNDTESNAFRSLCGF